MKLVKRHPLAFLISAVLLCMVLGYVGAMFLLEREAKREEKIYAEQLYKGHSVAPPAMRDGGPGLFYAMVGLSAGGAAGLVVGLAVFVAVKGGASEALTMLGLGRRG